MVKVFESREWKEKDKTFFKNRDAHNTMCDMHISCISNGGSYVKTRAENKLTLMF